MSECWSTQETFGGSRKPLEVQGEAPMLAMAFLHKATFIRRRHDTSKATTQKL